MKLPDFSGSESDTSELFRDQWSVPTELWIDSAGCLRRIRASFQIANPDEILTQTPAFSVELSLRDLGMAPAPAPPATAAPREELRAISQTSA
jgi:hypothetical protein